MGGLYTIRGALNLPLLLSTAAALGLALVSSCGMGVRTGDNGKTPSLSEPEKHRLYAAALAVSDSPLDSQTFKRTCQSIGIFDQKGQPNDTYMSFVTKHVDWSTSAQAEDFRRQINTKEKATTYLNEHLP